MRRLYWSRLRHSLRRYSTKPATEPARINQFGIQYLSESLHSHVFPNTSTSAYLTPPNPELLPVAQRHLEHNDLLGKRTNISPPISIDNFPPLVGKSLDEHFHRIGAAASEPYLSMARSFLAPDATIPPIPSNWSFTPGWTRYREGHEPESVDYPLESELVFDVEVLYKQSNYAVMATCASTEAWYGWVSPFLTNYARNPSYNDWNHLIPMDCFDKNKLIVGYNVSYDRSRVFEEYNIRQSKAFYLDGMALHVAVSGICSQQRPKWLKHEKNKSLAAKELEESQMDFDGSSDYDIASDLIDDPWLNKGSPNSLANVARFHCKIDMDKSDRDYFGSDDPNIVIENFSTLMSYCAKDVEGTYLVTKKLLPEFLRKVPHPVSFAALRHMGTLMLPTSKKWDNYVATAEEIYQENRHEVFKNLKERATELIQYIEKNDASLKPDYENDPWLRQLDWTLKQARLKKDGTPAANNAFLTGYPEWYRDLWKTTTDETTGEKKREINLTVRTRITPLLLRLKWEGHPLIWVDSCGWCFKVPYDEELILQMEAKNYTKARLNEADLEKFLPELRDGGKSYEMFKIPHPEGASKRTTSILSKSYLKYFEDGTLTSEYNYAQEILALNNTASYWMGNRNRISNQFVVYSEKKKNQFFETKKETSKHTDMGIILPNLCTMGTITRRATENTWLTASNAKKNRIGSELKSLIEAPAGYTFVGADVDSEELWIASLVGDSMFGIHGSTALGWMTLEGDKSEKTDLHSKTAEIMGISRGDAKVFNYGRIYGAGVNFATRLLKQCNSKLSDSEAAEIATKLYSKTKGSVSKSTFLDRRLYHGGTESVMFNALEAIASLPDPRTPVLGAAITDALTISNLNKNEYLTSRINWTIQSSGVDYLHLLIVSMAYLIERYGLDARLAITVHDELRFLVKEEHKYKLALLLQISNVWTRAMFSEQLGIKELPQNCAFFSEVDIDHVLRKEVGLECVTPSQPNPIPPGESLDILKLLEICEGGSVLGQPKPKTQTNLAKIKYQSREPVISNLNKGLSTATKIAKIRLQNSVDKQEWRENVGLYLQSIKKVPERQELKIESKPHKPATKRAAKHSVLSKSTAYKPTRSRAKKVLQEFDIGAEGTKQLEEEVRIANGKVANGQTKVTSKVTSKTSVKPKSSSGNDALSNSAGKLTVTAKHERSIADKVGGTTLSKKPFDTKQRSSTSRLIRRVSNQGDGTVLNRAAQTRPKSKPQDQPEKYPKILTREEFKPSYKPASSSR